jgi:hypothetical protein
MNHLISMFIDDELDMDEKITLVENVREDATFTSEALALLHQEKLLRSDVTDRLPVVDFKSSFNWKTAWKIDWRRKVFSFSRPIGIVTSGVAAAVMILLFFAPSPKTCPMENRFVIYQPDVKQVEITGSFTDWKKLPMQKIGTSGYWELILSLPEGEHRFIYILEGTKRVADPTIPARELDDFGGQNSILRVRRQT